MRKSFTLIALFVLVLIGGYAGTRQCTRGKNMNQLPKNWTLYIGDRCPYCKKVTDFLSEQNATITIVDAWKDQEASDQIYSWTQRRTVPYLRMGDAGMHESDDIIARLKQELA